MAERVLQTCCCCCTLTFHSYVVTCNISVLYFLNCMKFGHLLFWKIVKIIATRCQILWLKCTKFDFGWGYAPDPAGGLTVLPQPLAGFKGAYFSANLFTVDSRSVVPAR